jgi:hypothetical protein
MVIINIHDGPRKSIHVDYVENYNRLRVKISKQVNFDIKGTHSSDSAAQRHLPVKLITFLQDESIFNSLDRDDNIFEFYPLSLEKVHCEV